MYARSSSLAQRLLGAVDLAIDFATLGEYGLEPVSPAGPGRERVAHEGGWEALGRPTAGNLPDRPSGRRGPGCGAAPRRRRSRIPA